jgi:hypothetical protein
MHSLGKQPIDDFMFIIPYNTHHTSHRTFNPTPPHAPTMPTARDNAHHTSHQTFNPTPPHVPTTPTTRDDNMSISQQSLSLLSQSGNDGFDDIDVDADISSQTLNLQIYDSTEPTIQATNNHKRIRHNSSQSTTSETTTPTYIYFNTQLNTTHNEIFKVIESALATASFPPNSISPQLHSWAIPSISQLHKKQTYITIYDPSLLTLILNIIQTIAFSLPQMTNNLPALYFNNDIDITPFSGPSFPRFCRLISCPYHNGGHDIFPNDKDG